MISRTSWYQGTAIFRHKERLPTPARRNVVLYRAAAIWENFFTGTMNFNTRLKVFAPTKALCICAHKAGLYRRLCGIMCRGLVTPPPLAEFDGQWGTSFLLSARKAAHITYLQCARNVKKSSQVRRVAIAWARAEDVGKYRHWVSMILEYAANFSTSPHSPSKARMPGPTETPVIQE